MPLTMSEATSRAGLGSKNTWVRLEKGLPIRGLSLAAAERVLGYPNGSFDAYLRDGTPVPDPGEPAENERTTLAREVQRLQELIDRPTTTPEVRGRIRAMLKAAADLVEANGPDALRERL